MNTEQPLDADFLARPDLLVADFRPAGRGLEGGDEREGAFYRYTPEIKLAVRVALAVQRPLLIFGASGCGKSSLVANLAKVLKRRYYEFVVQSRSEARDLYYRFDAIRRLGEAQLGGSTSTDQDPDWRSTNAFVEPGPLWWVYDPESARRRGAPAHLAIKRPAHDPGRWPDSAHGSRPPAILLIDEIDKADLDFANNLLVPLGSRQFSIDETGDRIEFDISGDTSAPLVVITSNRERELPAAFVRRCIVLDIAPLDTDGLLDLARRTFQSDDVSSVERWTRIAEIIREMRHDNPVSSAEFLDTIRAIEALGAVESEWRDIILRTSWTTEMSNDRD